MHGGKIPCAERELAGNCRPVCGSSLGLLFADGAKTSGQNGHSSSFFGAMSARDARNEQGVFICIGGDRGIGFSFFNFF